MEEPAIDIQPTITQLLANIKDWGIRSNIIAPGTLRAQYMKLVEQLCLVIRPKSPDTVHIAIGDSVIVLVMFAGIVKLNVNEIPSTIVDKKEWMITEIFVTLGKMSDYLTKHDFKGMESAVDAMSLMLATWCNYENISFQQCIQLAWDRIKDIEGVLVDEIYITKDDPRYPEAVARLEAARS